MSSKARKRAVRKMKKAAGQLGDWKSLDTPPRKAKRRGGGGGMVMPMALPLMAAAMMSGSVDKGRAPR